MRRQECLQRRQPPNPAQVPERREGHSQEPRGRRTEDKICPHRLIEAHDDRFLPACKGGGAHFFGSDEAISALASRHLAGSAPRVFQIAQGPVVASEMLCLQG